jgi:hypothetical protein
VSVYTDEEAREATEVAQQLKELALDDRWQYLVDFVKSRAIAKQNRMIQGGLTTLEAYREEAGWLKGAQYVLDAPKIAQEIAANMAVETEIPA